MKYTIETNGFEAKETLEFRGKTYTKTTKRTDFGCKSLDVDFYEQMESDGIGEHTLDKIWDTFDGFMVLDAIKIGEDEWNTQ